MSNAAESRDEDGQDLVDVTAGRLLEPVLDGDRLQRGVGEERVIKQDGDHTKF